MQCYQALQVLAPRQLGPNKSHLCPSMVAVVDIDGRSRMGSTLKLSRTTSPNNSSVGSYGVGGVVGVVGAGVAGFVIGAVGAGGALLVM
jgi:hypothetical protein